MEKRWFEAARAAKFPTADAAAKACGVSTQLINWLEVGSTTAPELAKKIGKVLELSKAQVDAITCQESLRRREREKGLGADERIVLGRWH